MSEARAELPKGWKWVTLGDVAEYHNGRAFKPAEWTNQGLPIIRIQNLNSPCAHLNYFVGDLKEQHLIDDGDLLVSWSASLDVYVWQRGKAALNQHIFKVIENPAVIQKEYLYFALKEAMSEIRGQVHGATMKHITKPEFEAFAIPLPPFGEQKAFASLLAKQMAEVDMARAATEAQLEAAEFLRDAYLQNIFESNETQEWQLVKLGSLLKTVQNGIYKKGEFYRQGHPFLRMYNIANDSWYLILDPLAEVALDAHELEKYQLKKGDLLISRVNSFELVGKCAYVGEEASGYVFENMMIRLQVANENVVNPLFLAQQISTRLVRKQIQSVAKRAIGQSSINSTDIKGLEIRLPEIHRQKEISSLLNELTEKVGKLQQTLQEQYSFVSALPTSLLRQAFSGELTRQPSPEDLRAALTCLAVERLHHRVFFGVVQLMKVLYFAQAHLGIPLGYTIRRHTYGPFDKAVYNLEREGQRQGWFQLKAEEAQGSRYLPGADLKNRVRESEGTLSRWRDELDGLLELAESFDTTGLEALATLHAAWNDLLLEGRQPSGEEIIEEVLGNWPSKADKFQRGELRAYLTYLKASPYVPKGTGRSTKQPLS